MRIQTIHRNQMGDVFNECSAHGFQITTADGGRITIMVDGDGLGRAEPPSAPVAGGLIEAAKAAESMLRTIHECASHDCEDCREHAGIHAKHLRDALAQQPAAADEAMVERIAALLHEEATDEPWTVAGVEHPGPDRDYYRGLARKVAALAQQPAAVDEFAADRERLLRAFMMECGIIGAKEAGVNLARGIKAALSARQPAAEDWGVKTCYQCNRPVTWLAPDSRCVDCTRLTPDEVGG